MFQALSTRDLGTIDGFTLTAYELPDHDATPHDADCYSPDDITAWRDDRWYYAGVVVTASRDGIELGSAAIWGCDTGTHWDRDGEPWRSEILTDAPAADPAQAPTFAHGYGTGLIAEAITEATAQLQRLIATSPSAA